MAATATSVIDLRPDEAEIRVRMPKKTRQHIRKGNSRKRRGSWGDETDLEILFRLPLLRIAFRSILPPLYRSTRDSKRTFAGSAGARCRRSYRAPPDVGQRDLRSLVA
jgi:hypothetical protein